VDENFSVVEAEIEIIKDKGNLMKIIDGKLIVAASLVIGLSACSPSQTADDYINKAMVSLEQSNLEQSRIQLKNAVKSDPKNIQARILLGKVNLNLGNGSGAEKELSRALALGGDANEILPLLIESLMFNGDYDGVLNYIDSLEIELSQSASDDVYFFYAIALSYLSQLDQADEVIKKLENSLRPEYQMSAMLFNALKSDNSKKINAAIKPLLTSDLPNETWFLIGKVYLYNQYFDKATAMFVKYQGLRAQDLKINLYKAQSLLGEGKLTEAEKLVDSILNIFQEQPLANQLKGIIAYKNAQYDVAVSHAEKAIQNGLDTQVNRLVAGVSNFLLNNLEISLQHLNVIKSSLSKDHPAKRILILTQLKLGKTEDATESILNSETTLDDYNELLLSIGHQFIRDNKTEDAQAIIAKATQLNNNSNINLSRLGLMKTSLNDLSGLEDLKNAITNNPDDVNYRLLLISALVYQKDLDKALEEATKLAALDPNNIVVYNLAGSLAVKLNKTALARSYFKKAEELQPNNILSLMFYALMAEEKGDIETAYSYVTEVVKDNPQYIEGIKKLYTLSIKKGSVEEILKFVSSLSGEYKENIELQLIYAGMLFEQKDYEKVVFLLKGIEADKSFDSTYWLFLGDAYTELGDFFAAHNTYQQWIKAKPKNGMALYRDIFLLERLSKNQQALELIQKALNTNAENDYLTLIEAYFLVQTQQYKEAENKLMLMSDKVKALKDYQGILGLARIGNNKFSLGLKGLLAAYSENPSSRYAQSISYAYIKTGKPIEGRDFLEAHVKEFPRDYSSSLSLAGQFMPVNEKKATVFFERALLGMQKNIFLLNNLTLLHLKQSNTKKAEAYINKAISIAPSNITILDTYAQVLLATNKLDQAIKIYQVIHQEKRLTDRYKINYVEALIEKGDLALADSILSSVNSDDKDMKKEVERLYKVISK